MDGVGESNPLAVTAGKVWMAVYLLSLTAVVVFGAVRMHLQDVAAASAASNADAERTRLADLAELRNECPTNLDSIKTAEMSYDAAFDGFVYSTAPEPRAASELTAGAVPWDGISEKLGWKPDGAVRGSYWVNGYPGFFQAFCVIDADGDHALAMYIVGPEFQPIRLTPDNVF